MRSGFVILTALFFTSSAQSQKFEWAFPVIPGTALLNSFKEGMAQVTIYNKLSKNNVFTGFINRSGQWAIEPKYNNVTDFSDGLAGVSSQENSYKWGFIDKTGKLVIPMIYDLTDGFSEGIAAVKKDGKWMFIDKSGKQAFPLTFSKNEVDFPGGKKYSYDRYIFKEGLCAVNQNDKWGFIDKKGAFKVKPAYDQVGNFSEGFALVLSKENWGYIKKDGSFLIEPEYSDAWDFSNGIAIAQGSMNNRVEIINRKGEMVTYPEYSKLKIRSKDYRGVKTTDNLYGFADAILNVKIEPQFENVTLFSEGLAGAKKDGKWGFIDSTGKWIINPIFTNDMSKGQSFSDGFCLVKYENVYWYIRHPLKSTTVALKNK